MFPIFIRKGEEGIGLLEVTKLLLGKTNGPFEEQMGSMMVYESVSGCEVNWLLVPFLWQESIFPGWETPRKGIDDNWVPFGGSVFRQTS